MFLLFALAAENVFYSTVEVLFLHFSMFIVMVPVVSCMSTEAFLTQQKKGEIHFFFAYSHIFIYKHLFGAFENDTHNSAIFLLLFVVVHIVYL